MFLLYSDLPLWLGSMGMVDPVSQLYIVWIMHNIEKRSKTTCRQVT